MMKKIKSLFGSIQPEEHPDFRHSIESEADFNSLVSTPPTAAFSGTRTVKCVVDLRSTPPTVYFLQSVKYPFHFRFCKSHLLTEAERIDPYAHHKFNARNYTKEDRQYLLLTVSHYDFVDKFVIEPWPADNLSASRMAAALQLVASKFKIGTLFFRAMSDFQETVTAPAVEAAGLRVISSAALFGKLRFQAVCNGSAVGRLRFLKTTDDAALQRIRPFEIVVISENVLDLPLCASLITTFPQTPLSHTALLCQNRGTPSMFLAMASEHAADTNAKDRERIARVRVLDGQWVKLEVRPQDFTIAAIPKAEAVELLKKKAAKEKVAAPILLRPDFERRELFAIDPSGTLPHNISHSIGAKAFGLARAARLLEPLRSKVPLSPIVGIVLPFAYYRDVMREIGADKLARETIAALQSENARLAATSDDFYASVDPSLYASALDAGDDGDDDLDEFDGAPLVQSFQLDASRGGAITTPTRVHAESLCAKVERALLSAPADLAALQAACDALQPQLQAWNAPVILRSSSNVEDLDGFNGAGLYASVACREPLDRAKLAGTILKCFASMWTKRAVIERFSFGVDEETVAMALLVQPYATNIVANGVALSKIPFRADFPGTYINVQHGDHKVTDADGTAEVQAVYDEGEGTVEIVSRSSHKDGAPVLREQDARHIHATVMLLGKKLSTSDQGAVDVEFIVQQSGDERNLLVLQCRPCVFH